MREWSLLGLSFMKVFTVDRSLMEGGVTSDKLASVSLCMLLKMWDICLQNRRSYEDFNIRWKVSRGCKNQVSYNYVKSRLFIYCYTSFFGWPTAPNKLSEAPDAVLGGNWLILIMCDQGGDTAGVFLIISIQDFFMDCNTVCILCAGDPVRELLRATWCFTRQVHHDITCSHLCDLAAIKQSNIWNSLKTI